MTAQTAGVKWRIAGEEVGGCNCAWGCPCQFNAPPNLGGCEGVAGFEIREGHFGATPMAGVRFAQILAWPGRIDAGNGTLQVVVDEGATPAQREAVLTLNTGRAGGGYFEIFASTCSTFLEPVVAPVLLETDRERRTARLVVPGIIENLIEPIRNPVTGEAHRARIVLPGGFEFAEAEMGDSVRLRVTSGPLDFAYEHTYAQLNAFDWSNG